MAEPKQVDILQGTLNMMILRVLQQGSTNGYEIAKAIEQRSEELLQVEHGSLYPALRRLEERNLIKAEWRVFSTKSAGRVLRFFARGRKTSCLITFHLVRHLEWCSSGHEPPVRSVCGP